MQSTLRPYATAGAVIVSAGLIAAIPMATPTPHPNTVRDVALTAGPSDNAFTVDGTTFDPGSGGYNDFGALAGLAPLLEIGSGSTGLSTNPQATQPLEVYENGSEVGTAHTSVNAAGLLGFIDSSQFTVQGITPTAETVQSALTSSDLDLSGVNVADLADALTATSGFGTIPYGTDITSSDVLFALLNSGITLPSGVTDADIAGVLNGIDLSDLPDIGTVYGFTKLPLGLTNVYEAVPNDDGTAAAKITDTLVTPPVALSWHNESMTTRERLHLLVDAMDDEQAERALRAVEPIAQSRSTAADTSHQPLPTFVGSFDSGRQDLSQRADELFADGFGR